MLLNKIYLVTGASSRAYNISQLYILALIITNYEQFYKAHAVHVRQRKEGSR